MPSPADILMPNGALIGSPGSDLTIREVPGGAAAAQQMFDELSVGGKENTPPGYQPVEEGPTRVSGLLISAGLQ